MGQIELYNILFKKYILSKCMHMNLLQLDKI